MQKDENMYFSIFILFESNFNFFPLKCFNLEPYLFFYVLKCVKTNEKTHFRYSKTIFIFDFWNIGFGSSFQLMEF